MAVKCVVGFQEVNNLSFGKMEEQRERQTMVRATLNTLFEDIPFYEMHPL